MRSSPGLTAPVETQPGWQLGVAGAGLVRKKAGDLHSVRRFHSARSVESRQVKAGGGEDTS